MKNDGVNRDCIEIRPPRLDDLAGVMNVVRTCHPYLTTHAPYIYWMQIRQSSDVCAIASLDGEIVGWCSVLPGIPGTYFVHQLGVTPKARQHGVARSLLTHLVDRFNHRASPIEIQFTIDRRNGAALGVVAEVARHSGMRLRKLPEAVGPLEGDYREDLYAMTGAAQWSGDVSNEVANVLWTTTERTEATVTSASSF